MTKAFMNFWVYVYPFGALTFFYYHWSHIYGRDFALFMILVPTLYGYIMPGIAVNILKKWKFNTKFRLGNYYAHHGFKIAGNINTSFFLVSYHSTLLNLSYGQMASLILACGCVQGFIIWWHDTVLIKMGKLELNNVLVTATMSPEEKAYSYAPICFSLAGASFALCVLTALKYFENYPHSSSLTLAGVIIAGFGFLSFPPTMAFNFLEWRAKRKLTKI